MNRIDAKVGRRPAFMEPTDDDPSHLMLGQTFWFYIAHLAGRGII